MKRIFLIVLDSFGIGAMPDSESGIAPIPKESRTIRKIRFIKSPQKKAVIPSLPKAGVGIPILFWPAKTEGDCHVGLRPPRNDSINIQIYLFSIATATSRATFIMVVKEF